jgi:hypothetical protein
MTAPSVRNPAWKMIHFEHYISSRHLNLQKFDPVDSIPNMVWLMTEKSI